MSDTIKVGAPPNREDKFWLTAAENATPEKSIDRLDTHGKYLFATVGTIGTLLTGFGIFSPLGATILGSRWMVFPVILACLSLAFAMMGITPRLDRINRSDIVSIRAFYNNLIRRRGRFVLLAGVLFSLSLLSVAVVLAFSVNPSGLTPAISASVLGAGDKAALSAKIEFQRLAPSLTIETEISGYDEAQEGGKPTALFKDISRSDQSGSATVSAQLDQIQSYKAFVINCRVKSSAKLLYEKQVEIRR